MLFLIGSHVDTTVSLKRYICESLMIHNSFNPGNTKCELNLGTCEIEQKRLIRPGTFIE